MTQNNNSTSHSYRQLNYYERVEIEFLHRQGKSVRFIALKLGRAPSTISRELKRGSISQMNTWGEIITWYDSRTAQKWADAQAKNSGVIFHPGKWAFFFEELAKASRAPYRIYSVDTFVHYFKEKLPHLPCPSTTLVYRYIDSGILSLRNIDLPAKLRRRIKRYTKPHSRQNKHVIGQSIEERPEWVSIRLEQLHWEGDLVNGKGGKSQNVLMVLTERSSRYSIIKRLPNATAAVCKEGLEEIIAEYGVETFKSITFDNGTEFSRFSEIENVELYFEHPYSPWEGGSNEHFNELIREFIPKSRSINDVTDEELIEIQDCLNDRSRKKLNYKSATDIFELAN